MPAARAVLIASATSQAAPRALAALPPRSRVAAITGAAIGVQTVAASAFSPRTVSDLAAILVCPNAAPCLACPNTRFCIESMSINASSSPPGSSGVRAASSASTRRCTAASWRTLPQLNARKNEPSVDGARTPPNVAGIAPWRNRSMPSMSSAPAIIPAISEPTFTPALTPTSAVTRTWWETSFSSPTSSANRIAGTSPACDTRLGSSNLAWVFAGACNNRIYEVPFPRVIRGSATPIIPGQRALLSLRHTPGTIPSVDSG